MKNIRVPAGLFHWRIEKKGFAAVEGSLFPDPFGTPVPVVVNLKLDAVRKFPDGMVHVPVDNTAVSLDIPGYESVPPLPLQDYWIDKYEATNKQFKEFIDRGGYSRKEFWEYPFVKDGQSLSWDAAMRLFRDNTARPTWRPARR